MNYFPECPDPKLNITEGIIPLHISDDVSSLSAILLNDDYYRFMMEGRKIVQGIGVLDASHIIPFKMFAWLDLKRRSSAPTDRPAFEKEESIRLLQEIYL